MTRCLQHRRAAPWVPGEEDSRPDAFRGRRLLTPDRLDPDKQGRWGRLRRGRGTSPPYPPFATSNSPRTIFGCSGGLLTLGALSWCSRRSRWSSRIKSTISMAWRLSISCRWRQTGPLGRSRPSAPGGCSAVGLGRCMGPGGGLLV